MQVSRSVLKDRNDHFGLPSQSILSEQRWRNEEIIPGTHRACVRQWLFSSVQGHSTLNRLRCLSSQSLPEQKQRPSTSTWPLMLGIDGKDDIWETPSSAGSWMLSKSTLRGLPHSPFSHWLDSYPGSKLVPFSPLQNCSPVKHASFLVGCRWTSTLLFKLNSPTPLLAHIAKNQDCQGYQEPVCDILI